METKICNDCNQEFSIENFNWKNKKTGKKQPWCKPCFSKRRKKYYYENRDYYVQKSMNRKRANYARVLNHLASNPCVDCGESDLVVLTFDHVRGTKVTEIPNMLCSSWAVIQEEIDKCDVRCFNCHAKRTATQQGWLKSIF